MTWDQDPPDETDYRFIEEGDARDAAEAAFIAGYDTSGQPLTSEERDVVVAAWWTAWSAGARFEREWAAKHHPTDLDSMDGDNT